MLPYAISYALSTGVKEIFIFVTVFKILCVQTCYYSILNKNVLAHKGIIQVITASLHIILLALVTNIANRNITIAL